VIVRFVEYYKRVVKKNVNNYCEFYFAIRELNINYDNIKISGKKISIVEVIRIVF